MPDRKQAAQQAIDEIAGKKQKSADDPVTKALGEIPLGPDKSDSLGNNYGTPNQIMADYMAKKRKGEPFIKQIGEWLTGSARDVSHIGSLYGSSIWDQFEQAVSSIAEYADRPKRTVEANFFNLKNVIDGSALDEKASMYILEQVISGHLSPEDAVKMGVRINSHVNVDWVGVRDWINFFKTFGRAAPEGGLHYPFHGEDSVGLTTKDEKSGGALYINISEEQMWKEFMFDKVSGNLRYEVMDNLTKLLRFLPDATVYGGEDWFKQYAEEYQDSMNGFNEQFPNATNAEAKVYAGGLPSFMEWVSQKPELTDWDRRIMSLAQQTDLSLMDAGRLFTLFTTDPLFMSTDFIAGGANYLGKILVRGKNGVRVWSLPWRSVYNVEDYQRYFDWREVRVNRWVDDFTETYSKKPTQVMQDDFFKELPDFKRWQEDIEVERLMSLTSGRPPKNNTIRELDEKIFQELSKGRDADLQKVVGWREAIESEWVKLSKIRSGLNESARPLDEVLLDTVESLREDPFLANSWQDLLGQSDVADDIAKYVSGTADPATFYARMQKMGKMKSVDELKKWNQALDSLDRFARTYRGAKRRLLNAGLTEKQVSERMEQIWADMIIGIENPDLFSKTALGVKNWEEVMALPIEVMAFKEIASDPRIAAIIKANEATQGAKVSLSNINPFSFMWGDPAFKGPEFTRMATATAMAEHEMMTYASNRLESIQGFIEMVGPRLRDRMPWMGRDRKAYDSMVGELLSLNKHLTDEELARLSGMNLTTEGIDDIVTKVNFDADKQLADIGGRIRKVTAELQDVRRQINAGQRSEDLLKRRNDLDRSLRFLYKQKRETEAKRLSRNEALRKELGVEFEVPAREFLKMRYPDLSPDEIEELVQQTIQVRSFVDNVWEDLLKFDPDIAKRVVGRDRDLKTLIEVVQEDIHKATRYDTWDLHNDYFDHMRATVPDWKPTGATHTQAYEAISYAFDQVNQYIHMSPILKKIEMIQQVAKQNGNRRYDQYWNLIANRIRGVPTPIDEFADSIRYATMNSERTPPWLRDFMSDHPSILSPTMAAMFIHRSLYYGALRMNPGFVLKNLFGNLNTIAKTGMIDTARGLYRFMREPADITELASLTYTLEKFFDVKTSRNMVAAMLSREDMASEYFNRGIAFWAGLDRFARDLMKQGLVADTSVEALKKAGMWEEAMKIGIETSFTTQHVYDVFGKPMGFLGYNTDLWGAKMTRPAIQFVNYWFKQTDFVFNQLAWQGLKRGEPGGFIRMMMLTGVAARTMESANIDATQFAGATYGSPGVSPAVDFFVNIVEGTKRAASHDPAQATRHFEKAINTGTMFGLGMFRLPGAQISRVTRGIPLAEDMAFRSSEGKKISDLSDDEFIKKIMGIPTMTAMKARARIRHMRADEANRVWTGAQVVVNISEIMNGAKREERDLVPEEIELIEGLMNYAVDQDLMITPGRIRSYLESYEFPVEFRIALRNIADRAENIKAFITEGGQSVRKLFGDEDYEAMKHKLLTDSKYVKETQARMDAIKRKSLEAQ